MVSRRTFYGAIIVLVAFLLVTSSVALLYYNQYQLEVSKNQHYVSELNSALASYKSLSGSFNSSLQDYNRTLSLLAVAVANLNTSTPAYRNASVALSSLWNSYLTLSSQSGRKVLAYEVRMLVDYGNGTRRWYNGSTVQPGWNGYVVTLALVNGNVQATWYPQYGEHFVTGIGGVLNTQNKFWFLLTYSKSASWQVAQVGADDIPIFNGTIFAWTYCPANASYGPACPLP